MSEITSRIDNILATKNMSRAELCRQVGITPTTYSSWVSRGNAPQSDCLYKIAKYLGVSMEFLISGASVSVNVIEQNTIEEKEPYSELFNELKKEDIKLLVAVADWIRAKNS